MPLRLYNTLTRKKETFRPLRDKQVGIYACGPTVYWFAHLGNLRSYVFEDILRRVLEYNDYKVKHVMNITDVGHLTSDEDTGEDKIEKGARKEGKSAREIADFYTEAFFKDIEKLNIEKPRITCKATEHIKEQINLVKILEKKGFTYQISDGVYFNTSKITEYGRLAKLDVEGLRAGARVETVEGKKNSTDFALWKLTPPGVKRQQEWDSPWGKGFPGWHLECSAMSQKYLGTQFDIHCGGIDHIPVHHTNEIAQSQAAYGEIPAKYWIHGEFLLIDGKKMAKSDANIVTIENISKKFNPLAFRYLNLTAHYHSKLNLTWESMEGAQNALDNLYEATREFKSTADFNLGLGKLADSFGLAGKKTRETLKKFREYKEEFTEAVNDDLDTPKALGIAWKLIGDENIPASLKSKLLEDFDRVFGLKLKEIKPVAIPEEIKKMLKERAKARKEKDWVKSDELRQKIENKGWLLEDTPKGTTVKPKK